MLRGFWLGKVKANGDIRKGFMEDQAFECCLGGWLGFIRVINRERSLYRMKKK